MKSLFALAFLLLAGNAFAAQNLCGVSVQDHHVYRPAAQGSSAKSVNYVRDIFKVDQAVIKECFTNAGAVIVGTFPDGEIRAVIL